MFEPKHLLRSYLRGIRLHSQASRVSLFIPTQGTDDAKGLLLHDGDGEPAPELKDLKAAHRFASTAGKRAREVGCRGSAMQLASAAPHSRLVHIPSILSLFLLSPDEQTDTTRKKRRTDLQPEHELMSSEAWLALRFDAEVPGFPALEEPFDLTPASQSAESWAWMLAFGGALVWHDRFVSEILLDPVTGLPGRQEFQTVLEQLIERSQNAGLPLTLALINPDQYGRINQLLGREAGDATLLEIGQHLIGLHRSTDFLARYGGAVFAVVLLDTAIGDALKVVEKTRRAVEQASYHDGSVKLRFSAGLASYEPRTQPDLTAQDLIGLSDRALAAAKARGGGRAAVWESESEMLAGDGHDPLSGVFTANPVVDYRNMALLLKTLHSMATRGEVWALAQDVLSGITTAFDHDRLALMQMDESGQLTVVASVERDGDRQTEEDATPLTPEQMAVAVRSVEDGRPVVADPTPGDIGSACCAVPMIAGSKTVGTLYLEKQGSSMRCQANDLEFLAMLASQLGFALDRARLTNRERLHQEDEHRRLRAELEDLRGALARSQLIYRSAEMEDVLDLLRRVAPTDATVLITGESGTGKELVARAVHELSPRRRGPRIIVDCTSIPDTLVESELFGHERGAFTGAARKKSGRLVEANGGTLLLDEISELPLSAQAKLLRFVQDRQVVPVGGSKNIEVDVRIVACTNRDLASEVNAGRFREDLYHRLAVIRLEIPPLRRRRSDILPLAQHFLEFFSTLHGKQVRSLAPEAETRLLEHNWHGNVRELRNCIQRAVILSPSHVLAARDLSLETAPSGVRTTSPAPPTEVQLEPARAVEEPAWTGLEQALDGILQSRSHDQEPIPLGSWLRDELILLAHRLSGGVGRRAAALLGIPESTLRRRLTRAKSWEQDPRRAAEKGWPAVQTALESSLQGDAGEKNLLEAADRALVAVLENHYPGDIKTGAAYLGVSPPTYRRRLDT